LKALVDRLLGWLRAQTPLQLVTLVAAVIIAGFSVVAIAIEFDSDGEESEDELLAAPLETATVDAEPTGTPPPGATPDPNATPLPSSASSIVRVLIPVAVVDTDAIVDLGLAPDGSLAVPTDASTIAYYQFSGSLSEFNSSAVIGGVATRTAEVEGILANIGALAPGDQIVLELADGTSTSFRVFSVTVLPPGTVLPEAVGCTASACDPRGTMTVVGFQADAGNVIVQAQRA
jgi:hypothetical protein